MRQSLASKICLLSACLTFGFAQGLTATAQTPKSYTDYRKQVVHFPLGAASFVDRVHSAKPGPKKPPKTEADPANALGEPDYERSGDGRAYTLGCRGQVTFEFTDNAIVDLEGPDLYVFEVGNDVEPTIVSLSNDAKDWTPIGQIKGGKTSIDLADYDLKGRDFRFVRLQDAGKFCSGNWPGADIDAIGAIGSAIRLRLESRVLFDFDKHNLKRDADAALNELHEKLKSLSIARITIVGHTDDKGADAYNQKLSERRAQSVAEFLKTRDPAMAKQLAVTGRGESEPVESNETDKGRAANRRVELVVIPK